MQASLYDWQEQAPPLLSQCQEAVSMVQGQLLGVDDNSFVH